MEEESSTTEQIKVMMTHHLSKNVFLFVNKNYFLIRKKNLSIKNNDNYVKMNIM